MNANQQLTSVKLNADLFQEFKISCIRYKFSLQKLAERSIHLFLVDEEFRKKLLNHNYHPTSTPKS